MMNGKNSDHHIDPLEMEPSLNGQNGSSKTFDEQERQPSFNPFGTLQTLGMLIWVYASYYKNVTVLVASFLVIVIVIWSLEAIAGAATDRYHKAKIAHDYTSIESDFQLAQVDHWCLHGGDDDCRCDDPSLGIPRDQAKGWIKAHHLNKKLVKDASLSVDFVVLGDAAVEEWNARHLGKEKKEFKAVNKYWNQTFTTEGGGELEGLALGIAGDTISNLRWRLRHGEGLKTLNPDVWWILIGMNDLGFSQCSEEIVLLGILKLAEEIHRAKPSATIIVNSILPRKAPLRRKKKQDVNLNPYIHVVNAQLQKFCAKHEHIDYVDTTSLFLSDSSSMKDKEPSFKADMFQTDGIHLSEKGHEAWGDLLQSRVKPIVDTNRAANGQTLTDDSYADDMFDGYDYPEYDNDDNDWVDPEEANAYADDFAYDYGDDEFRRRPRKNRY